MKKKISALTLIIIFGFQYYVFAESPCITTFAINYAVAQAEYASDIAFCIEHAGVLIGPCREEAQVKYNDAIYTVFSSFNGCCCAYELSCCN